MRITLSVVGGLGALLAACSSSSSVNRPDAAPGTHTDARSTHDGATTTADAPVTNVNYVNVGPRTVSEATVAVSFASCETEGVAYTPSGTAVGTVILSHGFARSAERMQGTARHLASWGIKVVTPEMCHLSALDTDHPQNGEDLASYGVTILGPRLYAGHSAGGLAAMLAAANDSGTMGVLGLDLTDANGLAVAAAGQFTGSRFGIMGEPSSCNSNGNGVPLFDTGTLPGIRVLGATHCDFEAPTSSTCTLFCGAQTDGAPIINAFATAYVLYAFTNDPAAAAWVNSNGSERQRLIGDGVVESL